MRTLLFLLCLPMCVVAKDRLSWPDRGGPTTNGIVAPQDAKDFPTQWSEDEHIAWKISLEGEGHSTPVIGQDRIWFTAATKDGRQQFVYCINEESGKVLHHKLLFENPEPEELGNNINTYASPSCVLEPGVVYVHFGSYGTAKLNPENAEVVWQRRDIECRHFRGPGSSPVLYKDLLILTFDGIDQQFLMALNKHTGETVWRTERTTDYGDLDENGLPKREGDLRKGYSTPGLVSVQDRTQLVSIGSRAAFAYDADTGQELWTITHDDFNAASRPSFFESHAILNTGSRGANLLAVKLDDTTRGNVDETHVTWNRERGNARLSTPVLYEGHVYQITDNGIASCINAKTGEELWTGRVGGTFVSSAILANGLLYYCNEEGETTLVPADPTGFAVQEKNTLEEGLRASPAAANGAIYLRTFNHLYKIKN